MNTAPPSTRFVVAIGVTLIGILIIGISTIFFVVSHWRQLGFGTQWQRLTGHQSPVIATKPVSISPPNLDQRSMNPAPPHPSDETLAAAVQAHLIERLGRMVIDDAKVRPDSSISGDKQILFLYGIKPINSKQVCTRPSGERWACGLHAYATLRNSIEHKKIICDPKKIFSDGVRAICHMGSTDVASILVRDGLAELDGTVDDADLVNAQAFAKSHKLGIWAN
jgi:endonuclease YncB( thermonuclease family)